MIVFTVAIAGGVGSVLRYHLDRLITHQNRTSFPFGTLIVNLLGATTLGAVTALSDARQISDHYLMILGTGLLGGFTTFSTLVYESYFLLTQRGRRRLGVLNLTISFIGGLALFYVALELTLSAVNP